jgi:hypothetical protein
MVLSQPEVTKSNSKDYSNVLFCWLFILDNLNQFHKFYFFSNKRYNTILTVMIKIKQ